MKLLVLQVMKKCLQCLVSLHQTWHQDKLNGILLNTSLSHWSTSPREQSAWREEESAAGGIGAQQPLTDLYLWEQFELQGLSLTHASSLLLNLYLNPIEKSTNNAYSAGSIIAISKRSFHMPTYYSQHRHIMQWKAKLQLTGNWAPKVNDSCSIYKELCIYLHVALHWLGKWKRKRQHNWDE